MVIPITYNEFEFNEKKSSVFSWLNFIDNFSLHSKQGVFIFIILNIKATEFNGYVFPRWADSIGWMVGASTLFPFFFCLFYHLWQGEVNMKMFFISTILFGDDILDGADISGWLLSCALFRKIAWTIRIRNEQSN